MPGSQNTSFIPKHTPSKAERKSTPRQLFIGTLIVRILFFAVLIASVGAFAYDRRLSGQLADQVEAFRVATQSFEADEARLQRVLSIDRRLSQVNYRLQNSASMSALLTAVESATLQSAQVESFTMTREGDAGIILEMAVRTDTFDSVLFQREVLERSDVLKSFELADVTISSREIDATVSPGDVLEVANIGFLATFEIDPTLISVVPTRQQLLVPATNTVPPLVPVEVTNEPETGVDLVPETESTPAPVSNQENI